jgi:perosamine synthetase
MNPRKQLDLRPLELGYGLLSAVGLASRPSGRDRRNSPTLDQRLDALVCLSVRSGLDLLLTELAWPVGSEVLVSAITIPDISRILHEHGLTPIPVDINPSTLAVDEIALAAAITPRTRAVLVAHLFGARISLEGIVALARAHGLAVWEDCAQAYTGDDFTGHAESDVVMFSFGTIKTATALGGGVLLVRDDDLRKRLVARHAKWPMQSRAAYAGRLLKFGAFLLLQNPPVYGVLWRIIQLCGRNPDTLITAWSRGFAGHDFFRRLRRQPHPALRRMITYRLSHYDSTWVQARAAAGERVSAALTRWQPLGKHAATPTHWLFPLRTPEHQALRERLLSEGFDATRAPSSLHALEGAPRAQTAMAEVLYVPVYASMSVARLDRMTALINSHPKNVSPQ